ncbi:hypothetical protein JCM8547_002191 [Rhodosporidiobolus lusitaniae]
MPLRFALYRPLSQSSSPSPVLSVALPVRPYSNHSVSPHAQDDGLQPTQEPHAVTLDLREHQPVPTVEVVRTLDPEPREPFLSLSRLFLACSLTPLQGLLRFSLDPLSYSLDLSGLAPFPDLWVPLQVAREVAKELGRDGELSALLQWETRAAWSVEDKEEGGMVHNWKIPSPYIDPSKYSTALMLSTSFPRLTLLPSSTQLRTLLPSPSSLPYAPGAGKEGKSWEALWAKVAEWSVRESEGWLEAGGSEVDGGGGGLRSPPMVSSPSGGKGEGEEQRDDDLSPFYTFTTLTSSLSLLCALPSPPSSSPTSPSTVLSYLPHLPPLSRSFFLPSSSLSPASSSLSPATGRAKRLYTLDLLSRLVLSLSFSSQVSSLAAEKEEEKREEEKKEREEGWREDLLRRVEALEDAQEGRGREEEEEKREAWREEVKELVGAVGKLAAAVSASPASPPAPVSEASSSRSGRRQARGKAAGWTSLSEGWEGKEGVGLLLLAVFVMGVAVGVGVGGA